MKLVKYIFLLVVNLIEDVIEKLQFKNCSLKCICILENYEIYPVQKGCAKGHHFPSGV